LQVLQVVGHGFVHVDFQEFVDLQEFIAKKFHSFSTVYTKLGHHKSDLTRNLSIGVETL
jgi:hypothetical protein